MTSEICFLSRLLLCHMCVNVSPCRICLTFGISLQPCSSIILTFVLWLSADISPVFHTRLMRLYRCAVCGFVTLAARRLHPSLAVCCESCCSVFWLCRPDYRSLCIARGLRIHQSTVLNLIRKPLRCFWSATLCI